MKNNFLQEMQKRGYLNQCTNLDELSKICNKLPTCRLLAVQSKPMYPDIVFLLQISLNLSKFVH